MPRRKPEPDYIHELAELECLLRACVLPVEDVAAQKAIDLMRQILPRIRAALPEPPMMSKAQSRKLERMLWVAREWGNGKQATWDEIARKYKATFNQNITAEGVRNYWNRYRERIGVPGPKGQRGRPKKTVEKSEQ